MCFPVCVCVFYNLSFTWMNAIYLNKNSRCYKYLILSYQMQIFRYKYLCTLCDDKIMLKKYIYRNLCNALLIRWRKKSISNKCKYATNTHSTCLNIHGLFMGIGSFISFSCHIVIFMLWKQFQIECYRHYISHFCEGVSWKWMFVCLYYRQWIP